MIAPIQQEQQRPRTATVRHAHRLVAATLLKRRRYPADDTPKVPGWKAWAFAAWVVAVVAVYFAHMIGWL